MKTFAIISTDWHIKADNTDLSLNLMGQQIQLAKESEAQYLICLGDVFDSRRAQPENVLNTFGKILDMIHEAKLKLICIPGNHDKTNYRAEESFLRPFKNHPALMLFDIFANINYDNKNLIFVPFYEEDLWKSAVKRAYESIPAPKKDQDVYLFSHQAVHGASNNDGSKVDNSIDKAFLKRFKKVFFGHYHNEQQPIEEVYQLASWKQSNFGEDASKGFYILSHEEGGDFEIEFMPSEFPAYLSAEIDASELDKDSIRKVVDEVKKSKDNFRLVLQGDMTKVSDKDLKVLQEAGVKVKKAFDNKVLETLKMSDFRKREALETAFKEFCEHNEYSYEEGIKFLETIFE